MANSSPQPSLHGHHWVLLGWHSNDYRSIKTSVFLTCPEYRTWNEHLCLHFCIVWCKSGEDCFSNGMLHISISYLEKWRSACIHRLMCVHWISGSHAFSCSPHAYCLTYWGRVYESVNYAIFGSSNGLLPGQRQAIVWTNAGCQLDS